MAECKMKTVPNGHYSCEMRSGKILNIDEGFTNLLGYTKEDVNNGLVFKQLVPDIEYDNIIKELRETFINNTYACYQHEVLTKSGDSFQVITFFSIKNKLLEGHRVLEIAVAEVK